MMNFPTEKHKISFEDDLFGYQVISKNLLEKILLNMDTPNCFGLYGDWGTGKSTMIQYICNHLDKDFPHIKYVKFDSWFYENYDDNDIILALLNEIKEQLYKFSFYEKLKLSLKYLQTKTSKAKANVESIDSIGLGVFSISQDLNKLMSDYKKIEESIYNEDELWVDYAKNFRNQFSLKVCSLMKINKSEKLIIFIDNLDRCTGDNVVKILERIKTFLFVENVIFVFAIDRRVIGKMVATKYGMDEEYGYEFLMKIIPYYFEMPVVTQTEVVEFYLSQYGLTLETSDVHFISRILNRFSYKPRLARHIISQFCMRYHLIDRVKEYVDKNEGGNMVKYMFLASFLICNYPYIFVNSDFAARDELLNILFSRSASEKIRNAYPTISSKDRGVLIDIVKTAFPSLKASANIAQLKNCMNAILKK